MSDIVKDTIDLLKKEAASAVIKALVAKISFFGSWFMNPILAFIVPIVINYLYEEGAFAVDWVWILIQNSNELSMAIKTKDNLQKILAAGGDYKKAEAAFDQAGDDLIRRNFNHLPG